MTGKNFPPCFNLGDFHGTNVVQANLPFLSELNAAIEAGIAEGGNRVNVPPLTLTMTPEQAHAVTMLLSGQTLSKPLGAFVCKLKDQVRQQRQHDDDTVGRIEHADDREAA